MILSRLLLTRPWALLVPAIVACVATCEAASGPEQKFLAENDVAMARMMADMAVKPTGDVDRDFVAMMVPHHQGAVDMAQIELRYGHNEQLRRLAQEIIVGQTQEIAVMHLAIGERPSPGNRASPAGTMDKMTPSHGSMAMPARKEP